eukprot:1062980-Amphidinium_carterae.1
MAISFELLLLKEQPLWEKILPAACSIQDLQQCAQISSTDQSRKEWQVGLMPLFQLELYLHRGGARTSSRADPWAVRGQT